eukprot:s3395_g7.t1
MKLLFMTLEDASKVLASRAARGAEGGFAESWVLICDFHGYSWFVDTDPRAAIFAARLLAHYPERLGRCLLVDAPSVFSGTWSAVRRILNEVTASKVQFVRTDDGSFQADLKTWASEGLSTWLLTEIEENRLESKQDGRKSYWRRPSSGEHDPRACPDFVASPEFPLTLTARLEAADLPRRAECSAAEASEAPTGAAQAQWPRQRQGLFEVLPVAMLCALSLASTGPVVSVIFLVAAFLCRASKCKEASAEPCTRTEMAKCERVGPEEVPPALRPEESGSWFCCPGFAGLWHRPRKA